MPSESRIQSTLYQIWIDENYVYCATISGLGIIPLTSSMESVSVSGSLVDIVGMGAFSNHTSGYSSVWANIDTIFLGSFSEGVKYLNKSNITTSVDTPVDIGEYVLDYLNYPNITSDSVRYLHGNGDKLLCITNSGIDVHKMHPQAYRSTSSESNAYKGFMTSSGKFYYTVSGTNNWSVVAVNTCLVDWSTPDYEYATGSGILASGIGINDLFVTEGTSSDGVSNTLFIATTSGAYIIDEYDHTYIIFSTTSGGLYGTDNTIAIWADPTAGLNNGKVYISTSDSFNVVSLETNSVVDYYTETRAGEASETLQGDDVVDINTL